MENEPLDNQPTVQQVASETDITQKDQRKFPVRRYILIVFILIFLLIIPPGAYFLGRNSVLKELDPEAPAIPSPNPVSQATPTSDPIADLKTYERDGFSFKYPNDWEIDGNNTLNKSVKYEGEPVYGDVTPGRAEVQVGSVENLSKEKNYQNSEFSGMSDESEAEVNGNKALKATGYTGVGGSVYYHAYFIEKDPNSSVAITMITQDEKLQEIFIRDFDQILSTFRFTQ